jgi:hypothetical protein
MAAKNPMPDHRRGIMIIYHGILFAENNKIPKVKIVVGQGTPKVGDAGYTWPRLYPRRG